MGAKELSRRQLLRNATVGAGLAAAGSAIVGSSPASAETENVLSGIVERVDGPRTLRVRDSEGPVVVQFSEDAKFWRDHPVDLAAFVPGDEVSIEGDWVSERVFYGTYMISTCRVIEGRIDHRSEDRFKTTGGTIRVTSHTESRDGAGMRGKPVNELGPGDYVYALGRLDPSSDELVAFQVGVRTP